MTEITSRWCVTDGTSSIYADTKKQVLKNARRLIDKRTEKGLHWTLQQEWTTPRVAPFPYVLIITRDFDGAINRYNASRFEDGLPGKFEWVDSSGTRSVWWFTESKNPSPDYERDAIDLPLEVFQHLKDHLLVYEKITSEHPKYLFMRRRDPGVGIYIPEIDDQRLEALKKIP